MAARREATTSDDADKPVTASTDPWDWMQPHDVARFGAVIMDPAEQQRWCRAVMLGGLPFMWHKAAVVRDLIDAKLALKAGDKVLLLGESLESCGFVEAFRAKVGPAGEVRVIDITDEARDAYFAGRRGSGGQLATWRYAYTRDIPDAAFDCVAVIQGVQHTDDWRATGQELLRIMKPGRNIVLAEITFSPEFRMKIGLDIHIEYVFEKIFSKIGFALEDFPYYSPQDLLAAFDGRVEDPGTFVWKGIEVFWGRKI